MDVGVWKKFQRRINMSEKYKAQKKRLEEILERKRKGIPTQNKKTYFERETDHLIKMLKKAEDYFSTLPYELKCDEDFKEATRRVWSVRKGLERLQSSTGFGWNLPSEELPKHDTYVVVSLDEEDLIDLALYNKDKGFLLDTTDDYTVKAWSEIPEWYDFEEGLDQ